MIAIKEVGQGGRRPGPVLAVRECFKAYPGVQALDGVNFEIAAGEVRALLGKNGAGKSTLVKILAGITTPDRGDVLVGGEVARLESPHSARERGIAIVNQELAIVPELSVAENIYLGRWSEASGQRGFVRPAVLEAKAARQLAELGVDLDPRTKAGRISIAHQQIVEIAKALSFRPRLLILDEPTSSLPASEVERLLALVRHLSSRGIAIIYVSHRMDEIPKIAHSVTVLRDGRHIATRPIGEMPTAEVVRLMTGGASTAFAPTPRTASLGEVALRVSNLSDEKLAGITFELRKGEILGLAGLLGSGRTRLLRMIYGLSQPFAGSVEIIGAAMRGASPRRSIACGLGFAPEDRKREGLALGMSVANNLAMSCPARIRRGGFLSRSRENAIAAASIRRLSIKVDDPGRAVHTLSGGNQQKIVLGKWLNAGIGILLLDEPTRGVDIEAKIQIYGLLRELAADGIAVIVASSEMEELFVMCDRLLVMTQGRIAAERAVADTSLEEIMQLAMAGEAP
ncbi:sugar ABC transporter ATP-binding protein [Labrys monachus]|uniref:ABC-type sugar transport system ATPase subunit n=1 Tax=Labrys monachus TaxID=217067 RepID=A0ABU0FBE4_9HYPH|nr:sugar ABC transporter ATP-binding protein [Labrys monachus]MDQ0391756.1 ABC-type sugar transport system ATPase subunit [Labrys monachus]